MVVEVAESSDHALTLGTKPELNRVNWWPELQARVCRLPGREPILRLARLVGPTEAGMENTGTDLDLVLVQVVDETGREIGWGKDDAERLDARLDDIRRGVASAAGAMSASITGLPQTPAWTLTEVSASFGLTLTAEGGVIVSKVPAGATFEVTLTYTSDT